MQRRDSNPDSVAVRALFDKNIGLAIHLSRRYARQYKRVNLEALCQDALLGLHRAAELFKPTPDGPPFGPYALKAILRSIWAHCAKNGRMPPERTGKLIETDSALFIKDDDGNLRPEDPDPGNDATACELYYLIENLPTLSGRERTILRLQCGDGLSVPEIAKRIGRSATIVSTESARGIRKLREAVAAQGMPALAPGARVKPVGTGRTRTREIGQGGHF